MGAAFDVDGLEPQDGDADGRVGQILFPVEPLLPGILREDLNQAELGTPRDLNNDGAIDALDHALDYVVLPVLVRVDWAGPAGDSRVEFRTIISDF